MKNCTVIISGVPEANKLREVELQPGTTSGDVLKALGLSGYLLGRESSGHYYAHDEEIYASVEDGSKLRATLQSDVGNRNAAMEVGGR